LTAAERQVAAGHVGRPHGLDGSFYVSHPTEDLAEGTQVTIAGRRAVVERRAGTADRPIIRLSGVSDRDAAGGLRGEPLLVEGGELEEGEYLIDDLLGCHVPGLGEVVAVRSMPSCDLLEVGDDAVLVPLVSDAVTRIDTDAGVIEVDRRFLGLDEEPS
jgi:16S rRNA processing protein RimM